MYNTYFEKDYIYIVAGEEMAKVFSNFWPELKTIPCNENMSIGKYSYVPFSTPFIEERIKALNASKEDYLNKMNPLINLDLSKEYCLVFGEDECCKKNMEMLIDYFSYLNYSHRLHVIVLYDEVNLKIKEMFDVLYNN
jgi:hypothetical protein